MAQPRGKFLQAVLVLVVAFLIFKFGIQPPMPFSVLPAYMALKPPAGVVFVVVMAIDNPMFRGARSTGAIRWGTIAPRSQYVLVLLAVSFTWLIGLMGFASSGIRQHWHIYGVLQGTSPGAGTAALGDAAN